MMHDNRAASHHQGGCAPRGSHEQYGMNSRAHTFSDGPSSWESSHGSGSSQRQYQTPGPSEAAQPCIPNWLSRTASGPEDSGRTDGLGVSVGNPRVSDAGTLSSLQHRDATRKRPLRLPSQDEASFLLKETCAMRLHAASPSEAGLDLKAGRPPMAVGGIARCSVRKKPERVGKRAVSMHDEPATHPSSCREQQATGSDSGVKAPVKAPAAAPHGASDQDSAEGRQGDDMPRNNRASQHLTPKRRLTSSNSFVHDGRSMPIGCVGSDAAGLELLSIDMSEQQAALDQALALPVSVEELQEGALVDVDDELLNSLRKKGKGGRNPASDARLDPNIDPKKAVRIMANRLSAARSKLRQKLAQEGQRVKLDMLALQKSKLASEIEKLKKMCKNMEISNSKMSVVMVKEEPAGAQHSRTQPAWPGGSATAPSTGDQAACREDSANTLKTSSPVSMARRDSPPQPAVASMFPAFPPPISSSPRAQSLHSARSLPASVNCHMNPGMMPCTPSKAMWQDVPSMSAMDPFASMNDGFAVCHDRVAASAMRDVLDMSGPGTMAMGHGMLSSSGAARGMATGGMLQTVCSQPPLMHMHGSGYPAMMASISSMPNHTLNLRASDPGFGIIYH